MAGEGEEVFLGHELQARASGVVTVVRYIGLGILGLSICRGKWQFALYIFIIVVVIGRVRFGEFCLGKMVLSRCRGKVRESGVCEQFALIMIVRVVLGEFCLGELPFAPTMLLQSYTTYPKDGYGNR